MRKIKKSNKLKKISYEVRGPLLDEVIRIEKNGTKVLKLNTGNPASFGFKASSKIIQNLVDNVRKSEGYSESNGIQSAREALEKHYRSQKFFNVSAKDIYTGNGVSELIIMSMQGFCNKGDEILVPMPDYPLWTASIHLAGGKPIHYICDEKSDWFPDIQDIRSKITTKTKGIVLINPNNPTGSVYPRHILENIVKVAREFDLVIFSDEIYEKLVMDDYQHIPIASLTSDLFVVTFSGLSKSHFVAGFRIGWMILSGEKSRSKDYIDGLNILSSMRLCSNVPSQQIIEIALNTYKDKNHLLLPKGRIYEQREFICQAINNIKGLSVVKPKAAFYIFPKIQLKDFFIKDDLTFVLNFLYEHHCLLIHGRGFNWKDANHFRLVYLPHMNELKQTIENLKIFLENYRKKI